MLKGSAATLFLAALAIGCQGDLGTGTEPAETPVPVFAYSWSGCAAWSCQSGQCVNDPAIWGACCTQTTPDGLGGLARPSCSGPAPYCTTYPQRCLGFGGASFPPSWCYGGDSPDALCHAGADPNPDFPDRCSPDPTGHVPESEGWLDKFPECKVSPIIP